MLMLHAAAAFWISFFGTLLLFAVAMAIKHYCCNDEPDPVIAEQSQRRALATLGAPAPLAPAPAAKPGVVLPRFPYAKGRASETLVCAICLEALRDGEVCSEVPGCRHVFHGDCVAAWARSSGSCPLCRARIVPGSAGAAAVAVADDMV